MLTGTCLSRCQCYMAGHIRPFQVEAFDCKEAEDEAWQKVCWYGRCWKKKNLDMKSAKGKGKNMLIEFFQHNLA